MTDVNSITSFLNTISTKYASTNIKGVVQRHQYVFIVDEEKEYISSLVEAAAKDIQTELKKDFQNTKFSVTTKLFSNRNTTKQFANKDTIDVSWTNDIANAEAFHNHDVICIIQAP